MTASLVSVLMPVFNGERFLAQAIESVLFQTYPRWELVIIDDGSTDATAEVIHNYPDARIKYYYQENRGQAAALNLGLRVCRGDYVTTLDADDWYPQDSLEVRVAFLDNHANYGVVYGDGYYCGADGKKLFRFSEHMPNGVMDDVYDQLIVSPFYGTGASVMARLPVIQVNTLHYDESIEWCQDWDFYIRLAELSTYGYIDHISVNYRVHENGMTLAMPEGRRLDSLILTRWKVLNTERFDRVSIPQQTAFFYDFLVQDLSGMVSEQDRVMKSAPFLSLPGHSRTQLIRYAANHSLLRGENPSIAKTWLMSAWKQTPSDVKTGVVALLVWLNPRYARRLVEAWQRHKNTENTVSPFSMIGTAGKSVH